MSALIFSTLLFWFLPFLEEDGGSQASWTDRTLNDGTRVTVVHVPNSPRQTTLTVLDHGLLDDGPDRTQWAHLMEHMLIRHHDPYGLGSAGLELNGETLGPRMHLDTYCEPRLWPEALEKHVAWLNTHEVDPDVLAAELKNIAQEEQFTCQSNATHKWALAAWNQVVRHGKPHVGLHADVAFAEAATVEDYLNETIEVNSIHVITIGPVATEHVITRITEAWQQVEQRKAQPIPPVRQPQNILEPAAYQATWDLPEPHFMMWYPVASPEPKARVSLHVIAQTLRQILFDPELSQRGIVVMVDADLTTPEGRHLLISASGVDQSREEEIRSRIEDKLVSLGESLTPSLRLSLGQAKAQAALPDLAAQRKMHGALPNMQYLESNVVLSQLSRCWDTGMTPEEYNNALPTVTEQDVVRVFQDVVQDDNRSTLLLLPAEPPEESDS